MKILFHISTLGPGGAEKVLTTIANHFSQSGWSVAIVSLASPSEESFYPLDQDIKYVKLNALSEASNIVAALRNNVARIRTLRNEIKRLNPDVIISFMDRNNVAVLLAAVGLNKPVIVSERVYPEQGELTVFWKILKRLTYYRASCLVVPTAGLCDFYRRWNIKNIVVISNPVNIPVQEHIVPNRHQLNTVLAVGRLTRQKGFDLLLKAFAKLVKDYPDWHLVIAGEGDCEAALRELTQQLQLGNSVRFVGVRRDIEALYADASIFVLSSRYEGFPNAMVEAMSFGLPVVATDCPTGPAEIVKNGENGILVPVNDIERLADALRILVADVRRRAEMGLEARHVVEQFSPQKISQQWMQTVRAASRQTAGA